MSTLTSTGSLAFSQIETEFDASPDSALGLNEYYDADPYHEVPASGTISVNDLRGSSKQTCRVVPRKSSDSAVRWGYSAYQGSSYYNAESGESAAAFGSISRNLGVMHGSSGGERNISAIVAEYPGPYSNGYNMSISRNLLVAQNNATSANGAWDTMYFFCDSLPYTGSGWLGSVSQYSGGTVATAANTVYSIDAFVSGAPVGLYNYDYKALNNTSPTAYGWFFNAGDKVHYYNNVFYTGNNAIQEHAANMLFSGGAAADVSGGTSSNEVYFYFDS